MAWVSTWNGSYGHFNKQIYRNRNASDYTRGLMVVCLCSNSRKIRLMEMPQVRQ